MLTLFLAMAVTSAAEMPDTSRLNLPDNLKIEVVARADNVRQLALADDGTLFAGSRRAGHVYAFKDANRDGIYETSIQVASNLNMPSGVAVNGNDLYVAEVHRILKFSNITKRHNVEPEVYFDGLPQERHHGWKYLKFGPDGALYFNIGAPCNICLSPLPFATLVRLGPNKQLEVVAKGVRNSVGFTWHPQSTQLWFTDNGRDYLGDDLPSDELNRLDRKGQHFGYPFRHANNLKDPVFGNQGKAKYTPSQLELGAHVAPLGLTFYTGSLLPNANHDTLFIAEHGSWNRSAKVGYRVIKVQLENGRVISHTPFISGWLQGERYWGRPNDVLVDKDGSLLISDDYAGVIYRVTKK